MGKSLNFDYSKPILVSIMKFIIFQIIRKYNLLDSSFCISVYGEQSSTQEEEKKTKSSTSSAADKCSEVKDIMNKNLQALNERGEKIEELQDKRFELHF